MKQKERNREGGGRRENITIAPSLMLLPPRRHNATDSQQDDGVDIPTCRRSIASHYISVYPTHNKIKKRYLPSLSVLYPIINQLPPVSINNTTLARGPRLPSHC
eukprot:GHVU01015329.1.p1 GENE.GHVU01015329.1~~GHVU01015329.1.p1  ORF type:complete len:104 (+),score=14.55 GHVU01015329.1:669-980(+)